jgi:hypothetical protein
MSIPTALVGIVAFFLPWIEISCGPIAISVSGYEIATGSYNQKLAPEHTEKFQRQVEAAMGRSFNRRRPRRQANRPPSPEPEPKPPGGSRVPLLWIVPVACVALFLLALFGVPRVPTLLVSLVASAYLAYFGVMTEQQATDPQYTGGIVAHSWLWGFWGCWLGIMGPAVVALLKPRRKPGS